MEKQTEKLETLRLTLETLTGDLPGVTQKRLFGCDGFFANEKIFALVWKTGRIGLKLPEGDSFCELMKTSGSAPWQAGGRVMAHWVLVPESYHDNRKRLAAWTAKAHAQAASHPARKAGRKKAPASAAPKRRVGRTKARAKGKE